MAKKLRSPTAAALVEGALDRRPVSGLTHNYYRYPARFSPAFARACIETYTRPGQVVLDPFMGGGTTVIEAMVLGRRAIGSDINSLGVFIARVKVSPLSRSERAAVTRWADLVVPSIRCSDAAPLTGRIPRNMTMPEARWLRKTISLLLSSLDRKLASDRSRSFARCVVLNVGQWALNGRRRIPTAAEFRERISIQACDMLSGVAELEEAIVAVSGGTHRPILRQNDAESLHLDKTIRRAGPADLVVTSPPYPGIHMLYHRWQVDGRKETDAPYWIAAQNDGLGSTYYNFADRRKAAEDRYFRKAKAAFSSIRSVMRHGAVLAQFIAFSDPARQLKRYLSMMKRAGFVECRGKYERRTWRDVPSRRWHASLQGDTSSSREVVLVHRAT
ncbi:MAG: site-specific DNA-methyltransferase [Planctomycetes bacterium]|nr:site-specific DNA-methyltransferase [Planctomycetota bacterium]